MSRALSKQEALQQQLQQQQHQYARETEIQEHRAEANASVGFRSIFFPPTCLSSHPIPSHPIQSYTHSSTGFPSSSVRIPTTNHLQPQQSTPEAQPTKSLTPPPGRSKPQHLWCPLGRLLLQEQENNAHEPGRVQYVY